MTRDADVRLDAYFLDTLMPDLVGHDRHAPAFLVYLFLWRKTRGERLKSRPLSLREIAEGTGLSKRRVRDAVGRLINRRLIGVRRESITAVAEYSVQRPWSGTA
jgi:hypothetical protein